jgi:ribosomal protein S18 acetylase RimI-like enzyme
MVLSARRFYRKEVAAMNVRAVEAQDIDHLARLWHQGWNDAHATLAPEGLVRARTLERFRERLVEARDDTRVIGPPGAPLGLCMIKDDELYQLYVAREARGSGIAAALIADGEARLAARGFAVAWLACAIGNDRAARFYEKCGWMLAREVMSRLETPSGVFEIAIWRYEKAVRSDALR